MFEWYTTSEKNYQPDTFRFLLVLQIMYFPCVKTLVHTNFENPLIIVFLLLLLFRQT